MQRQALFLTPPPGQPQGLTWGWSEKKSTVAGRHLVVDGEPVGGNFELRLLQGNRARANLIVQIVFNSVLLVETRRWRSSFRPEVGDIVRTPQFQTDEVVDLILPRGMMRDAIFGVDSIFLAGRHVAHRLCVARLTDNISGGSGNDISRRAGGVLQWPLRLAAGCSGAHPPLVRSCGCRRYRCRTSGDSNRDITTAQDDGQRHYHDQRGNVLSHRLAPLAENPALS